MRTTIVLFLVSTILLSGCKKQVLFEHQAILPQYISIKNKDDIRSLPDTSVTPYIYTKVISLRRLPVKEKKKKFVEMMLPSILTVQHKLHQKRERIEHIEQWMKENSTLLKKDSTFLAQHFATYQCSDIAELKKRLQPHAASIVLGQAALESGWGSSRFFKEANNVFGVWSYNSGEDRIQALIGRDSTKIFVRKYENIEKSVQDYYQTIARVNAYEKFRTQRDSSNNPYELIPFLNRYSEMRNIYTRKLTSLIKKNKLTEFDNYTIDQKYIENKFVDLSDAN